MKNLITYLCIGSVYLGAAQNTTKTKLNNGRTNSFSFLSLPIPARVNALGGAGMAIWDDDINLSFSNPALLNPNCSKQLAFNYVNFVSDLSYGNFAYAQKYKKYGTFGIGLQFFNHGKFEGRDDFDEKTNTFKAADYCLNLSYAKTLNKDSTFSLGIALKTIYSHYDIYTSFANAIDVGLTYHNKKQFTASILAKNYGRQWKSFSDNGPKDKLPTDVQLGFSKKISKAPFRIIFLYDELFNWDLGYNSLITADSKIDPFTNKPILKTAKQKRNDKIKEGFEKFSNHLTIGTEIILTKNFMIRVAYNFRKSQEMSIPEKKLGNGLSAGVGFKIFKFHLNYAYSKYSVTGNAHTFGITTNLNYFGKN